jgi:DNA-binding response OmpR family regulator
MLKRIPILLVTPDEVWRVKLYAQLVQNGFEQVSQAADAITALSLFYEMCPDLVVIEVELLDADGLALCQMIQTLHPTVKVVLVANDASMQMTAFRLAPRVVSTVSSLYLPGPAFCVM